MHKPSLIIATVGAVAFVVLAFSKANVKKQLKALSKSHSDTLVVMNAIQRVADAAEAGATETQLLEMAERELDFIAIVLPAE